MSQFLYHSFMMYCNKLFLTLTLTSINYILLCDTEYVVSTVGTGGPWCFSLQASPGV